MSIAPIVVAVSPTTGSPAALLWAELEAAQRDAPLRAVLVYRMQRPVTPPQARRAVGAEHDPEADARQLLDSYVRKTLTDPEQVEQIVMRGATAPSIAAASEGAQLLVLGEPATARIAGIRATLIAPQLVYRASCPVVVMPFSGRSGPTEAIIDDGLLP